MKGLVIASLIGCVLSLTWEDELTLKQLQDLDLKSEFNNWAVTFERSYPDIDEKAHR